MHVYGLWLMQRPGVRHVKLLLLRPNKPTASYVRDLVAPHFIFHLSQTKKDIYWYSTIILSDGSFGRKFLVIPRSQTINLPRNIRASDKNTLIAIENDSQMIYFWFICRVRWIFKGIETW